ncbi:restriction endonuclease subunit S [Streptococcus infantis]|uniref:restriction endonuclease subunit S n=1 Tax=Streptococcus infantis TaxID=68892 RepID=UPI0039C1A56E
MKKVKLGEVCEIRIGKTPNRSQTLYWGGDYPWLSISDMKGKILCTTKEKITQEAVQKEKMQIVSKGTVVMSFKLSIGKVGILAENMYTNEAIANFVVKNNKMLFNEYLYYALQGMNFDSLTDRAVMGKTLNKAKLNNLSIVYNEPFMQQQIVLRLDGVNKLIESRKQQLSELSKLVKSRFNEMFGDVILNDKEWKVCKWNEILTIRNGKNQKNVEDNNGQFPIYGSGGIIGYAKDWIVKKNSVIIGRKGNINKPILVRENFWNVDTAFGLEPTLEKINSEYLFYFCQLYNFEKLNKAVTIPSLTKSDLLDISIPLPPLSLQNEFADFVAQVDKSQLAIQKSLEELETLKKSLMQEYFG